MLRGPSTARRFIGSFAKATRRVPSQDCAPFCHASDSATTWSICTALLVSLPRMKLMILALYGSASVPVRTTQLFVPGLKVFGSRSVSYTHLRAHETRHDLV